MEYKPQWPVALTDSSPMPFGRHKGKALANVPDAYLLYLYNNGLQHGPLKAYITANLDSLQKTKKQRG